MLNLTLSNQEYKIDILSPETFSPMLTYLTVQYSRPEVGKTMTPYLITMIGPVNLTE